MKYADHLVGNQNILASCIKLVKSSALSVRGITCRVKETWHGNVFIINLFLWIVFFNRDCVSNHKTLHSSSYGAIQALTSY